MKFDLEIPDAEIERLAGAAVRDELAGSDRRIGSGSIAGAIRERALTAARAAVLSPEVGDMIGATIRAAIDQFLADEVGAELRRAIKAEIRRRVESGGLRDELFALRP